MSGVGVSEVRVGTLSISNVDQMCKVNVCDPGFIMLFMLHMFQQIER